MAPAASRAAALPPRLRLSATARRLAGGALALVALAVVANPLVVVPAGHRGVLTTFGRVDERALDEGLHLRVPIAQRVQLMSVQIHKGEGTGMAASRDLQQVKVSAALNYRIEPARAPAIYQGIGTVDEVGARIILPAVHEAVKAVVAQFTAEELVTQRAEVRERIRAQLQTRLQPRGIVVEDFAIVDFSFGAEFAAAIEEKSKAEQLKLKAERDLARIRVEAEQQLARAEAEAKALTLQRKAEAEALAVQRRELTAELLQWEAIRRWDGRLPQVAGGGAAAIHLPLPGAGK